MECITLLCFLIIAVFSFWLLSRECKLRKGMKNLKGKVVLITGASSGFGEAFAHAFHRAGCRLILAARREAELCRVRDDLIRINSETPHPVVLPMDMLEFDKLPYLGQKALDIHGHIDIFISNAGISNRCSILDCSYEVHKKIMDVNYFGHVILTKALLPSMVKRKSGHIVAISSLNGRISIPHRAPYAASKHALQAYCDSLRAEVASKGIKVSVFSPGFAKTNISVNSLMASGETFAVMDDDHIGGMSAEYVADLTLNAVASEEPELLIAKFQHRVGIPLRTLFPNLYFRLMAYRATTAE